VNYVIGDAKTNWVEGLVLVGFYVMIVCLFPSPAHPSHPFASHSYPLLMPSSRPLTRTQATVTWWYPGQEVTAVMLRCASVLVPDAGREEGGSGGGDTVDAGANNATGEAARLAARIAFSAARRAL
jgi:hypothetical protein